MIEALLLIFNSLSMAEQQHAKDLACSAENPPILSYASGYGLVSLQFEDRTVLEKGPGYIAIRDQHDRLVYEFSTGN